MRNFRKPVRSENEPILTGVAIYEKDWRPLRHVHVVEYRADIGGGSAAMLPIASRRCTLSNPKGAKSCRLLGAGRANPIGCRE